MKVKTEMKCPCGFKNMVTFPKPGIMRDSLVGFECEGCKSKFLGKFQRPTNEKSRRAGLVTASMTLTFLSTALQEILSKAGK